MEDESTSMVRDAGKIFGRAGRLGTLARLDISRGRNLVPFDLLRGAFGRESQRGRTFRGHYGRKTPRVDINAHVGLKICEMAAAPRGV